MTKEQLWKEYVKKYPIFAGPDKITVSPEGLKKMFDAVYDAAYDEGYDQGFKNGRAWQKMDSDKSKSFPKSTSKFDNLFKGLW